MAARAEPRRRLLRRRPSTPPESETPPENETPAEIEAPPQNEAPQQNEAARERNPRGHWGLLAFFLIVLLAMVIFQGYATHTVGASSESHGLGTATPLLHQRPVFAARGSRLVSVEPPPGRRVALTFDDGPNPHWTPRIAAELHAAHVPGTFFEIGSQAARYPGIVRTLVRDGDEIGNHTFTHVLLSAVPAWQRHLQIDLTEAVIAGITGHYTRIIRPPYSATPDAVTPRDEQTLANLAGRRYYIVLADYDSRDWERPGVPAIIRNATPRGPRGGIIMMHDGGGNRFETVLAVRELIGKLRARGFRFVTVSALGRVPVSAAQPIVRGWPRTRGAIFVVSVRVAYALTPIFTAILLAVAILVTLRALLLFAFATYHVRLARGRRTQERGASVEGYVPSAVIVVPAFNEAVGIERAVRSLAASDYPGLEVVVVDDGSTDGTADIVAGLDLDRVRLVRQTNMGKAAALQRGVEVTDSEIVVMVDADTLFEAETVRNLMPPFLDPDVGAVSGNTKVGNRRGLLGRWQHLEYVIGFNLDRRMYDVLRCMPTVPGAVGAFRRSALEEVGEIPGDTLAEDTDLTLAIGRTGRRVEYAEQARAWTEAPSTLRALWRQRFRWSFGTMQAVFKHLGAVFSRDPRQRRIGRVAIPYLLLFHILLPLIAPAIDLFALYGLMFIGVEQTLLVWGAFNVLQLATAAYGLHLDREPQRSLWTIPLQQFVYRQLMYLVIIESFVTALRGLRSGWRHLPRTGTAMVGAD